jgi:site-specific recombinase XerC
LPTTVRQLQPDHLDAFVVALHERQLRPTTILARHRALARFFGWLVDEGELTSSPMAALPRPAAPLPHPTVLSAAQIDALLRTCSGPTFEDVRDAAVIRLFVDTGLRLTETASL